MLDSPPPPPRPPQATGFRRLVATLAGVVAVAAVALAMRSALQPAPSPPPPAAAGAPEDPVERAMRLAGVDSTKRNAWVDDIPSADLSGLSSRQVEVFLRFANARRCTCGCGFTLAACRVFDPTCEVSGPIVAALLDSVARGQVADARGLRTRPASVAPGR